MMYRVYLKTKTDHGVEISEKTATPSPAAAEVAFRELLSRTDLRGKNAAAVLSLDNRHLMYHRFDRGPGQSDYVSPDEGLKLSHD